MKRGVLGSVALVSMLVFSFIFLTAPTLAESEYSWFEITAPIEGSAFALGQPVTIQWTGGDPSWTVDVQLCDVTMWTVAAQAAWSVPNNGSFEWTFPTAMPEYLGGPDGHVYQFYVQNVQRTMWTYGPCFTISSGTSVAIDIKPGSATNSINLKSKGRTPVAILTNDSFDAATVDPTTVRFGATGTEAAPVHSALEDVDGDGDIDMILHFDTQDTGIQAGDTCAYLKGTTSGGQSIEGSDSVRTLG